MLNVVDSQVYLSRPLSPAQMSPDQLRLAADQLRDFALGELAFIERELAEIRPLRADTVTDWERKQARLAEIQAEKWRWLGLSLGLHINIAEAWPWGCIDLPRNAMGLEDKPSVLERDESWQAQAWKIGRAWMFEQEAKFGKRPSREAIAEYLEGRLYSLGIQGPRGPLRADNILREALTGITKA